VILGYFCFVRYGYWYLLGIIVLLSGIYVLFMRRYFHLHIQKGK
ncbi:UDP-GlcNAc--UDP-phosphate GlcNAc-1-phosphate transferase, partial [Bacteroides cellulosilyticus]